MPTSSDHDCCCSCFKVTSSSSGDGRCCMDSLTAQMRNGKDTTATKNNGSTFDRVQAQQHKLVVQAVGCLEGGCQDETSMLCRANVPQVPAAGCQRGSWSSCSWSCVTGTAAEFLPEFDGTHSRSACSSTVSSFAITPLLVGTLVGLVCPTVHCTTCTLSCHS